MSTQAAGSVERPDGDGRLPSDLAFVAGESAVGRLVREHDWARTPIGPIEAWPSSLRTAVGVCLSSRHPMVIWWGPELVLIYNDAWVPILGPSKHPALGKPGASVWPEMWHIIGEQMRSVLETGRGRRPRRPAPSRRARRSSPRSSATGPTSRSPRSI